MADLTKDARDRIDAAAGNIRDIQTRSNTSRHGVREARESRGGDMSRIGEAVSAAVGLISPPMGALMIGAQKLGAGAPTRPQPQERPGVRSANDERARLFQAPPLPEAEEDTAPAGAPLSSDRPVGERASRRRLFDVRPTVPTRRARLFQGV